MVLLLYLQRRYIETFSQARSFFGRWAATGKHPFEDAVRLHVLPTLQGLLHVNSMAELKMELEKEFARVTATEARQPPDEIATAVAVAAEKESFSTQLDRRVRYWVDGLVIGSELFVRNTLVHARGRLHQAQRRLVRALDAQGEATPLCCFRQLRVLLE